MQRGALIALALAVGCAAGAQQVQSGAPRLAQRPAQAAPPVDAKRAQLKTDSERLAKAAAELKAMLAKTDENTMSLEVIKKAEEVQRLAKLVQKEMKEQ